MKISAKAYIKNLYHETVIGHWLFTPIKKLNDYLSPRILPEKIYIKRTFKSTFGYNLNLISPKTYNEKILWLQLNERKLLHTLCADKFAVRNYIKEKIGEQYLIPLVLDTVKPTDLTPSNLPNYPIIIKTNHGAGGHIIVRDKSKIDWNKVQRHFKRLLRRNYYYRAKEWQYKDIEPRIIVEKLLLAENYEIPDDYKFDCFNGKVAYINVIKDRFQGINLKIYDPDWKSINCLCSIPDGKDVMKPPLLDEMKKLAEVLAKDFKYVRVDMYYLADKIFFGELTFSPMAGFAVFNPPDWDRKFGDQLNLQINVISNPIYQTPIQA